MSKSNGFAMAELLAALAVAGLLSALLFPALARGMETGRRTACQSNLKQLGLILKMYSNESKGMYPPLRRFKGNDCQPLEADDLPTLFSPDGPAIFPEYLNDADLLACPSDPDAAKVAQGEFLVGGSMNPVDPGYTNPDERPTAPCRLFNISYNYYAWAIKPGQYLRKAAQGNMNARSLGSTELWLDEGFAFAWAATLYTMVTDGVYYPEIWDNDFSFNHTDSGPMTVYRLREGIERFWITDINSPSRQADAQSEVALMHDMAANPWAIAGSASFNHIPGGGNVLFMDGHVAFQHYPGSFPMSNTWAWLFSDPRRLFAR